MADTFTPTVLTIAGSDPYGGAGLQVDIKTIHAQGAYAFSIPTALTVQNSQGVKMLHPVPIDSFEAQLDAILSDIKIDVVKIGMLANSEIISAVVKMIHKYHLKSIVLDTVLMSTSGHRLLDEKSIEVMKKELFPLVSLITPNKDETAALFGAPFDLSYDAMRDASRYFQTLGVKAVLFKGGHSNDRENATDHLYIDGIHRGEFSSLRVETTHTHGTGCIYASAISAHLALGYDLNESIERSKTFLYQSLKRADQLRFDYRDPNAEKRKEPIL